MFLFDSEGGKGTVEATARGQFADGEVGEATSDALEPESRSEGA
jgi:hypothetical protein